MVAMKRDDQESELMLITRLMTMPPCMGNAGQDWNSAGEIIKTSNMKTMTALCLPVATVAVAFVWN
jgi:hypothetical protein